MASLQIIAKSGCGLPVSGIDSKRHGGNPRWACWMSRVCKGFLLEVGKKNTLFSMIYTARKLDLTLCLDLIPCRILQEILGKVKVD